MKTVKLDMDLRTMSGIQSAEKAKTRLENAGYKLIETIPNGLDKYTCIYSKEE